MVLFLRIFLNKPNSKTSAIRLRYYVKSEKQTFVYSTGISIEPKYWNKDSRMPKAKAGATGIELKQITNKLNRILIAKIIRCFLFRTYNK